MRQLISNASVQKIERLKSKRASTIESSHDFIPINDSDDNPLVFNNAYAKFVRFRNVWIQYEMNGGIKGFLVF